MPIDAALLKTGIAPPAAVIRQTAEEVLKGGDFRLDSGVGEPEMPLWLDLLLGLFEKIEAAFYAVGALPVVLRVVIAVVLVAILAAIVWHTVTAILSVIGVERPGLESRRRETRPVSPEELEEAATRAADSGDLVTAVRRLYQAALCRIEIGRGKPWPRGLTDRDVLHRTARSPLHPPLSGFIATLERAWYADQPCTAADLEACRRHHGRIVEVVAAGVLEPSRRSHPSPTAVEFSADALSP